MRMLILALCLLCSGWLSAQHTFSIVAVDPVTGEVGSAGATCLTSNDCGGCGGAIIISRLAPGQGAINAQATVCLPNVNANNGANQIGSGQSASAVLSNLLTFDGCQSGDTSNRQYGVITLDAFAGVDAVAFTGSNALNYAGHRTGPDYAIQGNILLGPQILDAMETNFLNATGPLCDRLMAALQGANVAGADSRCLPDGVSAKSAFIRVARPTDTLGQFWLDINVPVYQPGFDPIDSLQIKFDNFKSLTGLSINSVPGIAIVPDPKQGQLLFHLPQATILPLEIEVYGLTGQQLTRALWTESQDFRLPVKLSSGIYLIRLRAPGTGQNVVRKIFWP